ncbi:MAG: hypothetical protein ABWY45_12990 [Mycobacterium sp.]
MTAQSQVYDSTSLQVLGLGMALALVPGTALMVVRDSPWVPEMRMSPWVADVRT